MGRIIFAISILMAATASADQDLPSNDLMVKCDAMFGHMNLVLGMEHGPASISMYRHSNIPEIRHGQSDEKALMNYWGARKLRTELVYKPLFDQQEKHLIAQDIIEPLARWDGNQVNKTLFANDRPPFDENTPALIFRLKKPLWDNSSGNVNFNK